MSQQVSFCVKNAGRRGNTSASARNKSFRDDHLKSDPRQGIEAESLNGGIVRPADSPRDVADQLPLKDDDQHRAIETGIQWHYLILLKRRTSV